jgi:hypothetical protein
MGCDEAAALAVAVEDAGEVFSRNAEEAGRLRNRADGPNGGLCFPWFGLLCYLFCGVTRHSIKSIELVSDRSTTFFNSF